MAVACELAPVKCFLRGDIFLEVRRVEPRKVVLFLEAKALRLSGVSLRLMLSTPSCGLCPSSQVSLTSSILAKSSSMRVDAPSL